MKNCIKAILFDLDGILYFKEIPITGAIETIKTLRVEGYLLRFLTNTGSRTTEMLFKKLLTIVLRLL